MLDCPACSGPQALGGDCATCSGITKISQEIFDSYMLEKTEQEYLFNFKHSLQLIIDKAEDIFELKQEINKIIS